MIRQLFLWKLVKLKIKRVLRFILHGGLKYLSLSGIMGAFKWRLSNFLKLGSQKTIYWIGPFSPVHENVGDHAQTLGVQTFLDDKFHDYKIVRIYRHKITIKRLSRITEKLKLSDLVFIHSSGDFGSLHDVSNPYPGLMSFPEVRRQIVGMAPSSKIINLPTTCFYEKNEKGSISLNKDQSVFNDSNLTVLCREDVSFGVLQESLSCKSQFFPDFVFYLKPKPYLNDRKGVLVILRSDKEALLTGEQKQNLIEKLGESFTDVEVKDIMHEAHTIPDFALGKYMDKVFRNFQKRELIITDKMHGMITAVITQTPCVALSGGIPHKIKAYKSFLSGAVEFVDHVSELEDAIEGIRSSDYSSVDMSNYFERFRTAMQDSEV